VTGRADTSDRFADTAAERRRKTGLRAPLVRATMAAALIVAESRCTATLGTRKIVVAGTVAAILFLANFLLLAGWLDRVGVIGWAQGLRHEYLTARR